jgi:predicted PurR-regulated permease PerM
VSNAQFFGTLITMLLSMVVIFLGAVYFISNQIGQRINDLARRLDAVEARLTTMDQHFNDSLLQLSERVAKLESA